MHRIRHSRQQTAAHVIGSPGIRKAIGWSSQMIRARSCHMFQHVGQQWIWNKFIRNFRSFFCKKKRTWFHWMEFGERLVSPDKWPTSLTWRRFISIGKNDDQGQRQNAREIWPMIFHRWAGPKAGRKGAGTPVHKMMYGTTIKSKVHQELGDLENLETIGGQVGLRHKSNVQPPPSWPLTFFICCSSRIQKWIPVPLISGSLIFFICSMT